MTALPNKWALDAEKIPVGVRASTEPIVRFFSFHDSHPVAIAMVLLKQFGHEWITWEPDTLRHEILVSFNATSVSSHNWQKIQAVRTLLLTVGFWEDWVAFEKIVQALNNNIPRMDFVQRCTLAQLMAGVDMVSSLRVEVFGSEVARYVAACAVEQGVTYLPPPLDFAALVLGEQKYYCDDCHNVAEDDNEDGRCDACVGRFLGERPLNGKPLEGVADDVGRNIRKFMVRDPVAAKKRFEDIRLMDTVALDPTSAVDVQAGKLVVAERYMTERQQQMIEQLKELESWVGEA